MTNSTLFAKKMIKTDPLRSRQVRFLKALYLMVKRSLHKLLDRLWNNLKMRSKHEISVKESEAQMYKRGKHTRKSP